MEQSWKSAKSLFATALGPPLFWLVVFLKIAEGTVRNSLGKPALMVAYRPLPAQRRDRAQMVIETAIEPISTGLTGAILLLVNFVLAGAGLRALGRLEEARVALERAMKMDPQSELARTQLAELKGATRTGGGGG